jgi:hypothetical protein
VQDSFDRLFRKPHVGPKWFRMWFREALAALLAFVPLKLIAPFAVLYRFDSAIVAGHCEISC